MLGAFRQNRSQSCAAPPETVDRLETVAYDEGVFGDVEGARYPTECSICLESWEMSDSIKVTPCRHVFHEDCLRHWLRKARTCAVCRRDLVKAMKEEVNTLDPAQPDAPSAI